VTRLKLAVFIAVILSIWAAMHAYVFWRLASVPCVAAHVPPSGIICLASVLALSFPLARLLNARHLPGIGRPLELFSANWVGVLFLLFSMLLAADAVTLGGWLFPRFSPLVRGVAAIVALLLSAVACVQGRRGAVVTGHEVRLAGLPIERDGFVLIAISDLHLGTMIGEVWLRRLIARVNELKPDAVAIVGDLVDSEVGPLEPLLPALRMLRAPMGVWAVTGNHEYYAGLDRSVALLKGAGYTVLRDSAVAITPGVVIAGVDDLGTRRRFGQSEGGMEQATANRPPRAVVLLSHSPVQAEKAASLGVGLMLSGHTHHGQIWPFNYLVRLSTPFVGGRYEVGGMTIVVGRGTGTWGPRMRLWRRSEILRITLRSA
jgi:predicted MPP superfamily phosphohydrolase